MSPLPEFNEEELGLVVAYARGTGEEMDQAIVKAFLAANIEVMEKPTTLVDWINTDVLDEIQWSSGRPLYLCTQIWDHQVVITAEEIRVYSPPTLL